MNRSIKRIRTIFRKALLPHHEKLKNIPSLRKRVLTDGNSPVLVGISYRNDSVASAEFGSTGNGMRLGHYDDIGVFTFTEHIDAMQVSVSVSSRRIVATDMVSGKVVCEAENELGICSSKGEQLKYRGRTYRGGFRIKLIGGELDIVNVVALDDYVKGVLPYELHGRWPMETVKAQAVCIRTYMAATTGRHWKQGFDLCPSVHCQRYFGSNEETERTTRAVDETAGEFVTYNGKLIETVYAHSNGGMIEASVNVWGNDFPYYRSGPDPYESLIKGMISDYKWTKEFTGEQLRDALIKGGYKKCKRIVSVRTEKSEVGNTARMYLYDTSGEEYVVYGGYLCIIFGMCSLHFDFVQSGDVFTFEGLGHGHTMGMSQWGAYAMGMKGFTYRDILSFYFPGTELNGRKG